MTYKVIIKDALVSGDTVCGYFQNGNNYIRKYPYKDLNPIAMALIEMQENEFVEYDSMENNDYFNVEQVETAYPELRELKIDGIIK